MWLSTAVFLECFPGTGVLFCPQRLAAVCCVFCTLLVLSSAVFRCKFDSGRPQFDGGRPLFAACVLS